ncbi:hypothetical protein LTR37_013713 [Vermiconidia calcicola]|uniref:Uncharacterized protein n=1 Tax=Vermiconidia calcicola TaxID=1690605 RepID=A0ACC3MW77_9PEZI|nr:hypothetical protein LTR37_013713 [Vermiconidia calcicola]
MEGVSSNWAVRPNTETTARLNSPTNTSPLTTAGPSVTSTPNQAPAPESTAPQSQHQQLSHTSSEVQDNNTTEASGTRSRKRRRRESEASPRTAGSKTASKPHSRKRQRGTQTDAREPEQEDPSMRLEHNHEHRSRPATNGSSQNGSSPHTNGSAKNGGGGAEMETNGYHATNGQAVAARQDSSPFYGHDREEVTRILLQSLSDLGYGQAAKQLSDESGYELEIPSVAAFRSAVQRGEWEEAEVLLFGQEELDGGVMLGNGHHASSPSWRKSRLSSGSQNGFARHGLPLAEGADTTMLKFLLRQQKYLELLENRDLNTALNVLRNELTPLKRDIGRLHALSSLIMCQSAEDLRSQADWDGAQGESRNHLLSEISTSISPSVMIPEHRLATLFSEVQQQQILDCRYHNTTVQPSLYTDHECSPDDFPLQTFCELRNHSDEVWFLEFSHDGSMLATAGKDGLVCVYDTLRWKVRHEFREHERTASNAGDRGVCCVAFSPDDQYLISCSQNNELVVVNVRDGRRVATADHFDYPVTTAAWLPDSETFVVGTQGSRRPLGLYSLRSNNGTSSSGVVRNNEIYSWRDPPWDPSANGGGNSNSFRITDCAVSRDGTRMVATTLDNKILVYDLRSKFKIAEWQMEDKLTSINFSRDGSEMLLNMNEGRVLALSAQTGEVLMRYEGCQQRDFVIRSCFGGAGEGFVVSGSEGEQAITWNSF